MVRTLSQSDDAALAPFVAIADDIRSGPPPAVPLVAAPAFDWTMDADPLAIRDGRPFLDRGGFRALLPRRDSAKE